MTRVTYACLEADMCLTRVVLSRCCFFACLMHRRFVGCTYGVALRLQNKKRRLLEEAPLFCLVQSWSVWCDERSVAVQSTYSYNSVRFCAFSLGGADVCDVYGKEIIVSNR
jgi:hypothetical protein